WIAILLLILTPSATPGQDKDKGGFGGGGARGFPDKGKGGGPDGFPGKGKKGFGGGGGFPGQGGFQRPSGFQGPGGSFPPFGAPQGGTPFENLNQMAESDF